MLTQDLCHLITIIVIAMMGGGTMFGIFVTKKEGFGQYTLRAVGIVLVATLAALLAAVEISATAAAIAILGAIAGYLFGKSDSDNEKTK